jgi:hypothetical protein
MESIIALIELELNTNKKNKEVLHLEELFYRFRAVLPVV